MEQVLKIKFSGHLNKRAIKKQQGSLKAQKLYLFTRLPEPLRSE